ncbi:MAG: MarR family transcriptional regulator [Victivallaceae bacterium]|nr:MarR family transcriptional regulator [Victivallaceae bacterium]
MNRLADSEYMMLRNLEVPSRLMANRATQRLKELGVTKAQAQVLFMIHELEQPSQENIANELHVARTAIRLTLQQLLKDGYAERVPDQSDKRIHRLHLTAKGLALLPPIDRMMAENNQQVLAGLAEYEKIVFLGLLQKVYDNSLTAFLGKSKVQSE